MTIRRVGLVVTAILAATTAEAQVRGNVYLKTVRVTAVPKPPASDFWDYDAGAWGRFVGSLVRNESASFYPDIEVCIGSRRACRLVCVNAQLNADDPALRPLCGLQLDQGVLLGELLEVNGQPQWRPRDLAFEVNEIGENGNTASRRNIGTLAFYAGADPPILQPDRCSESEPCTRSVQTERGPLEMSFTTVFAGAVGTLPPTLPGAPGSATTVNPPPPSTSPTTTPEPEGWLAGLWNSITEPISSWWAGEKWLPFVQGAGDTYPSHQATAAQKVCCIHPNDVIQGWHNDCFVLSALAAVAMVSPGTIRNAIHDNGNGLYTVNFAGANQRRQVSLDSAIVEVSWWESFDLKFPTWNPWWWRYDTLQPYEHAQPADGGVEVWPILFERAYGEIFGAKDASGKTLPMGKVFEMGGDSGVVMWAITGRPSTNVLLASPTTLPALYTPGDTIKDFHELVTSRAMLRATLLRLDQLHRQGRVAIVAGSIGPCKGESQWRRTNSKAGVYKPIWEPQNEFRCGALKPGLVPSHSYYFKRYDDATGVVELGNPFGQRDASLSLAEFGNNFRSISYNTLPAVIPDCDCAVRP